MDLITFPMRVFKLLEVDTVVCKLDFIQLLQRQKFFF